MTPILIAAEQHHGTTDSLRVLTWNIGAWCSNYYLKKLIIALFSPPSDLAWIMMKDACLFVTMSVLFFFGGGLNLHYTNKSKIYP